MFCSWPADPQYETQLGPAMRFTKAMVFRAIATMMLNERSEPCGSRLKKFVKGGSIDFQAMTLDWVFGSYAATR